MKPLLKRSSFFLIAGLLIGVYYRELTKFMHYSGSTVLRVAHGHSILLGFALPLLLILLVQSMNRPLLYNLKHWSFYYAGSILTIVMMLIRGTLEVMEKPLSTAVDASISGISGVGHAIFGITLVLLFLKIIKETPNEIA